MDRNFTSVKKGEYNGELACYIIVENGITSHVPLDTANTDYQAILAWAAGNTIAEADS
jgi:hypothetical protein